MAHLIVIGVIVIIISAVHATTGQWPPQSLSRPSILRSLRIRCAGLPLDLILPPSIGSSLHSAPLHWPPLSCFLGPPVVLHSGEVSYPLAFYVLCFLSDVFHFGSWCYNLIPALVLRMIFNIPLSIRLFVTSSLWFWWSVTTFSTIGHYWYYGHVHNPLL